MKTSLRLILAIGAAIGFYVWTPGSLAVPGARAAALATVSWKLVTFDDTPPTEYSLRWEQDRTVVNARSDGGASGLVAELPGDLQPTAMSWRWRVDQCLENDQERVRAGATTLPPGCSCCTDARGRGRPGDGFAAGWSTTPSGTSCRSES